MRKELSGVTGNGNVHEEGRMLGGKSTKTSRYVPTLFLLLHHSYPTLLTGMSSTLVIIRDYSKHIWKHKFEKEVIKQVGNAALASVGTCSVAAATDLIQFRKTIIPVAVVIVLTWIWQSLLCDGPTEPVDQPRASQDIEMQPMESRRTESEGILQDISQSMW